jgi:tRNA pseudouridine55 synthase
VTSGILLLDKPQGLSSNAALQRVRYALGRIKGGHTGSLDPMATGMLPLCLGEATKVAGDLLEGRKTYTFTARLGERTSTGDVEGPVVQTAAVPADALARLTEAAVQLHGPSQQVPPMYSALKRDGQPLYQLARQGIEVERAPRQIDIQSLQLLGADGLDTHWRVDCSKGTYVRVLAEDLAARIGTVAHLVALRREAVEPFEGHAMVSLAQVLDAPDSVQLLPADAALPQLPAVTVGEAEVARLLHGQAVRVAGSPAAERARLYTPAGRFLGLGEVGPDGVVQPRRIFNELAAQLT